MQAAEPLDGADSNIGQGHRKPSGEGFCESAILEEALRYCSMWKRVTYLKSPKWITEKPRRTGLSTTPGACRIQTCLTVTRPEYEEASRSERGGRVHEDPKSVSRDHRLGTRWPLFNNALWYSQSLVKLHTDYWVTLVIAGSIVKVPRPLLVLEKFFEVSPIS